MQLSYAAWLFFFSFKSQLKRVVGGEESPPLPFYVSHSRSHSVVYHKDFSGLSVLPLYSCVLLPPSIATATKIFHPCSICGCINYSTLTFLTILKLDWIVSSRRNSALIGSMSTPCIPSSDSCAALMLWGPFASRIYMRKKGVYFVEDCLLTLIPYTAALRTL